jgi:membrane fusion protein
MLGEERDLADTNHRMFRDEVLTRRANRLYGDVAIAVPLSWQAIGFLMLALLIAAICFLASSSYSRIETVRGAIILDTGVAPIRTTRPGVISVVHAREGDLVRAGTPLIEIRAVEQLEQGGGASEHILESIDRQDAGVARQSREASVAAAAERARLAADIGGIEAELGSLGRQLRDQEALVASAVSELELARGIAARGFISRRDVQTRQEVLLTRRQQLAQLQQQQSVKQAALAATRQMITRVGAEARGQEATLASTRAALGERRVGAQASRAYVLTAPVAGRVTAVTARPGRAVVADETLLSILPEHSTSVAELQVPTSAAGFLAVGQEVRLAVDAFPYQRFGTLRARISQIPLAPSSRPQQGAAPTEPVYLVTAELSAPWVPAFGRRQPLIAGMTLSARIVTEKRTLLEWLFEPLFSVGTR